MKADKRDTHILDDVRAGRITTEDAAKHDRGDDWQTQWLYGNAPAWFGALDDDLKQLIGPRLWIGEMKTGKLRLWEQEMFDALVVTACELQKRRNSEAEHIAALAAAQAEIARLRAALDGDA